MMLIMDMMDVNLWWIHRKLSFKFILVILLVLLLLTLILKQLLYSIIYRFLFLSSFAKYFYIKTIFCSFYIKTEQNIISWIAVICRNKQFGLLLHPELPNFYIHALLLCTSIIWYNIVLIRLIPLYVIPVATGPF